MRHLRAIALLLVLLLVNAPSSAAEKPNFLIILADDCTFSDLPTYGGENAKTPNIDRLADSGLLFRRAYVSEAMCQPCRSELYTGMFPARNGASWNHSASKPGTKSLPHHLRPLGYRVGLSGKTHIQPRAVFPFENVPGFDPNCVRNPTQEHNLDGIRDFMTRDDEPFCLVVALVEPHVPWVMGDASQYPPESLKLPPNIADTPVTRRQYADYLAEITYMDGQVGEILNALEESGKADDTLVLFSSEQGAQFPGCKWTNWDTGLHTALIARWPAKIAAGAETDAIVQYADVTPTLVSLAGGDSAALEARIDGRSFTDVLSGKADTHRALAYGIHNNIPEGPPYPIRTVTDGEYRYIRNLAPDEIYIEKHLMGYDGVKPLRNQYWPTWVASSWNNEHTYGLVKRYLTRPPEELYHTASDPFEMNNLINSEEHRETAQRLSAELDRWMEQQGDPGAPVDSHRAHRAANRGEHLY